MQVYRDEIDRIYERAKTISDWNIHEHTVITDTLGKNINGLSYEDGTYLVAYAEVTISDSKGLVRITDLYATICPQVGRVRLYYYKYDTDNHRINRIFLPIDGMP